MDTVKVFDESVLDHALRYCYRYQLKQALNPRHAIRTLGNLAILVFFVFIVVCLIVRLCLFFFFFHFYLFIILLQACHSSNE